MARQKLNRVLQTLPIDIDDTNDGLSCYLVGVSRVADNTVGLARVCDFEDNFLLWFGHDSVILNVFELGELHLSNSYVTLAK